MKKLLASLGSAILAMPALVFAGDGIATSPDGGAFGDLLATIVGVINNTLIPFILAIAFLVFVWGVFQYFIAGGANDESKEKGKSLMVYAVAGFVLIIIFWGVVNLLATSTGLTDDAITPPKTGFSTS